MNPPAKDKCPNFKVDVFFHWLHHIWEEAWVLGEDFSIDKQTTKCQCECKGSRLAAENSSASVMEYRGIALWTTDIRGIFTSSMSQLIRTSSHRALA